MMFDVDVKATLGVNKVMLGVNKETLGANTVTLGVDVEATLRL